MIRTGSFLFALFFSVSLSACHSNDQPEQQAPPPDAPATEVTPEPKKTVQKLSTQSEPESQENQKTQADTPDKNLDSPKKEQPQTAVVKEKALSPSLPQLTETTVVKEETTVIKTTSSPDHTPWDEMLRRHVSAAGQVDYPSLQKESGNLDNYLKLLADRPVQSDWNRAEKMAYWINAYNAFTVKLILDHYLVTSITDIHSGNPWDVKWIQLGGQTYSLNQIENTILRPQFKDARIHFAVNCAARSCPPLLNRAWTGANLEGQLEQQTRAFINNPTFNQISPSGLKISKIFEWYATDFGNLIDFFNRYATTKVQEGATIGYLEYDWKLNN